MIDSWQHQPFDEEQNDGEGRSIDGQENQEILRDHLNSKKFNRQVERGYDLG